MNKSDNELHYSLDVPLNKGDTENTTHGCRHTNPDICGSCYIDGICAFTSDDHLCKKPSSKWKKYYKNLIGEDA